jgi:hypothetical protein
MATATTTYSGHVARAVRFFNEPELFVGIAVTGEWPNETSPLAPEISAVNLGRISEKSFNEDSDLSNLNCDVSFNFTPFKNGLITYVLTGNADGTYKLEQELENGSKVLLEALVAGSPSGNSSLIEGLTIKTPSTFTEDDFFKFKVDGPIGFKKVSSMHLVVPDVAGEIDYRGSRWTVVPANEAFERGARYVYIVASLNYTELPITDFRQIGVFSGLVRSSALSDQTKPNLLPSEVQTTGALELIDNRTVITRNEYQKETFSFIIEH